MVEEIGCQLELEKKRQAKRMYWYICFIYLVIRYLRKQSSGAQLLKLATPSQDYVNLILLVDKGTLQSSR